MNAEMTKKLPYPKRIAQELGCKPCPFCGGLPKIVLWGRDSNGYLGNIRCSSCGASTRLTHGGHHLRLETACNYWNKRINQEDNNAKSTDH